MGVGVGAEMVSVAVEGFIGVIVGVGVARGVHSPRPGEQACFEKWPSKKGLTGSSVWVTPNSSPFPENSSPGDNNLIPIEKT